jgi:hypothetical protein
MERLPRQSKTGARPGGRSRNQLVSSDKKFYFPLLVSLLRGPVAAARRWRKKIPSVRRKRASA